MYLYIIETNQKLKVMNAKTAQRIEMSEKNLKSVSGYSYNSAILAEVCGIEYITDGELVMSKGEELVYFENNSFVTKKNGIEVRRFEKSQLSEVQQEQLFCIWASRKAQLSVNTSAKF
jgi:hypothetical protein